MRAWVVDHHGEPADVLELAEVPSPPVGPGEVRVRVHAAAVGLPDVFLCRGSYAFSPAMPFTPGQEVCGTVVEVGDGADVAIGTRVMGVTAFVDGRGGFAEESVLGATNAFAVPDAMDDAHAAGFRIGSSTAWIGLVRRGALQAGETLVVLGAAGGSGVAAVQLGRALGARVLAVVSDAEKARLATELGADGVVDRSQVDVKDAVLVATDGRGADAVYDPVGGAAGEATLGYLAPGGRYLAVGFAAGRWPHFDVARVVGRNLSIVGVYAGGLTRDEQLADHEALMALVDAGALRSPVRSLVPFDDAPTALTAVATGAVVGKSVLQVP